MVKNRSCLICDRTGLTESGFCHECKGKGTFEVVERANNLFTQGKPDVVMLLLTVARHTSQEQYANIIRDYLESPN